MKLKWTYYQNKFEHESEMNDEFEGWYGLRRFAYDLTKYVKPKLIVELGTYKGTSFLAFCNSIKVNKLETQIIGIDTWKGDEHTGFYSDSILKNLNKVLRNFYKNTDFKLIRKEFDETVIEFNDKSIDILHIDGLHTYKAAQNDYQMWKNKVSDNGIILFHDIHYKKRGFGVYKLWAELKKNNYTLELKHSNGLGIIFNSKKLFLKLNPLEESWQAYYSSSAKLDSYNNSDYEKSTLLLNECNLLTEEISLNNKLLTNELNIIKHSLIYSFWKKYSKIKRFLILK